MAKCMCCGREMRTANGCAGTTFVVKGKKYPRIKVGDDKDYAMTWNKAGNNKSEYRCGDCGAKWGYYHHPGCDLEVCPICGGQAISCGCLDEALIPMK